MPLSFPRAQLSRILHPLAAFGKQSSSIMVLQLTGSCFLDLANISFKPEQRPEDLFSSLMSFIVLTWLRLLHPSLLRLVKQHYGT